MWDRVRTLHCLNLISSVSSCCRHQQDAARQIKLIAVRGRFETAECVCVVDVCCKFILIHTSIPLCSLAWNSKNRAMTLVHLAIMATIQQHKNKTHCIICMVSPDDSVTHNTQRITWCQLSDLRSVQLGQLGWFKSFWVGGFYWPLLQTQQELVKHQLCHLLLCLYDHILTKNKEPHWISTLKTNMMQLSVFRVG